MEKQERFKNIKALGKNEVAKLQSLRVKLTYATFIIWSLFVAFLAYISDRMVSMFVISGGGNVQIAILDKLMNIFSGITFILFLLVTLYVLGKSGFHLKFGVFELNMDGHAVPPPNGQETQPPQAQ